MSTSQPVATLSVGSRLTTLPVLFASDGKVFFAASGATVKVFSVATGEHLHTLVGHSDAVTGLATHPMNPLQLLTASRDGTVRAWDFYDGVVLTTITVGHPVVTLVVPTRPAPALRPVVYVQAATPKKHSVWSVRLDTGRVDHLYVSGKRSTTLAVSPKAVFLASVHNTELCVFALASRTLYRYAHARELTSVQFHPFDPYLVTGACDGQLVLWHGFGAAVSAAASTASSAATAAPPELTTSVLHWHAHPVRATAFSDDGAYLLSGGAEAVLVLWQLESGHRQFLPRVGAPITGLSVSPKGTLYALSCADNAIRLVGAVSSKVERTIRGLQCSFLPELLAATAAPVVSDTSNVVTVPSTSSSSSASTPPSSIPTAVALAAFASSSTSVTAALACGLQLDPRGAGHVVLPGTPGSLQFFDVLRDRHVGDLTVAARNNALSRTHATDTPTPTTVARAALQRYSGGTNHCTRLATVETRLRGSTLTSSASSAGSPVASVVDEIDLDDHMGPEIVLKFWNTTDTTISASASSSSSSSSSAGGAFVLNTRVDSPHKAAVTSLAFHPFRPLCVTASADRTFKVWVETTRLVPPTAASTAAAAAAASLTAAAAAAAANKSKGVTSTTPAAAPASTTQLVWSCQSVVRSQPSKQMSAQKRDRQGRRERERKCVHDGKGIGRRNAFSGPIRAEGPHA
jgi:NET1-associated nuclear protein 1 (U3 small nucleolar RNA-associated protein 17)